MQSEQDAKTEEEDVLVGEMLEEIKKVSQEALGLFPCDKQIKNYANKVRFKINGNECYNKAGELYAEGNELMEQKKHQNKARYF